MAEIRSLISSLDNYVEDIRCASLTFSINFFTRATFSEIPNAILKCQEVFLDLCPAQKIKFYATENMRKHKAVSKKTFDMLSSWLENPNLKNDYMVLELKDGESLQDAPKFLFKIFGCEEGSLGFANGQANCIALAFPPDFWLETSAEIFEIVENLCENLPFHSGSVGFTFYCSRYATQEGESFAWQKSMRHPEINIARIPQDSRTVEGDAFKTIGWLTIANEEIVANLGGISSISGRLGKNTTRHKVKGGYIFKIGNTPLISDRNRNESSLDYLLLYNVFKPMISNAGKNSLWFDTGSSNEGEQTEFWYHRFEK